MLRSLLSHSDQGKKKQARVVYHREEKTRDAAFSCAPIWTLRIFQMSILAHKIYTSEIIFTSQTATCLNLIHRLAYKLSIFLVHTIELSRAGREKMGALELLSALCSRRVSLSLGIALLERFYTRLLFLFILFCCVHKLLTVRETECIFRLVFAAKDKMLITFLYVYVSCVSAAAV